MPSFYSCPLCLLMTCDKQWRRLPQTCASLCSEGREVHRGEVTCLTIQTLQVVETESKLEPSKKIGKIRQRSQRMPGGTVDTRQKQTETNKTNNNGTYWVLSIQTQEMS